MNRGESQKSRRRLRLLDLCKQSNYLDRKERDGMFGDIAMITILVSINMAIMMLGLFMYYIGRSGQDGKY